jgi:S1-C subfamily serine protease
LLAALLWASAPQAGYEEGIQALNRADYDAALRELRPLAEQGHARAQWALGYMYSRGLGVPKDAARAERWRKRSVEGLLGKAPVAAPRQRPEVARGGSGSGFLVDTRGRALTSYHVVARCSRIFLHDEKTLAPASVLAADPASDLALLAATGPLGGKPALFRSPIAASLGERVMVAGYPLQGLLSTELQVASGMVSALAGPKGDRRLFQLSVPVQLGNSGGPVMDESGKVIGLVAGTLRGTEAGRATGVAPENVGFAVRGAVLQRFLDRAGTPYRSAPARNPVDTRKIARAAREFTVLVECLR